MQLQIENLSKRYPNGTQALHDVSLAIPLGMFGLLGPNGAGKSTLMRTLATLQEADSGSAQLGAIDLLRQKDEVRKLLGYLPQDFGLYPKVTAENCCHILRSSRESRTQKSGVRWFTRCCGRRIFGTIATSRSAVSRAA